MDENYSPSYMYIHDEEKKAVASDEQRDGVRDRDAIIRFDLMIVKTKDGRTEYLTAYGDGAHVRDVAFKMPDGKFYKLDSALHNMQIENVVNDALEITAFLDGKISYRYPEAN